VSTDRLRSFQHDWMGKKSVGYVLETFAQLNQAIE
jgi:hypothetical protein